MAEKSTTGVWLDKETGKIVRSAPRRGRQIVAVGHPVTKEAQALIDLYEVNAATVAEEVAVAEPPKPAPKPRASK